MRYINFNPTHIKTVTEIKKISSYISLEVLDMIFSHNIVIFPIFNGDLSCFKWDFCDNVFFLASNFIASILTRGREDIYKNGTSIENVKEIN